MTLQRPFDYVALESVLYQVFLNSTGLWTNESCIDAFNISFWLRAETMLQTTCLMPNEPHSVNSPVLGVPIELFRLALQTKQILQRPDGYNHVVDEIREAVQAWEQIVKWGQSIEPTMKSESPAPHYDYYKSASYLYALIASLLLEQVSTDDVAGSPLASQLPNIVPRDSWQIRKALQILQYHQSDEEWSSCYIGNWCVYTLGFFLHDLGDIELIRTDLNRRWEATKFMQARRFLADIEHVWVARSRSMYNIV